MSNWDLLMPGMGLTGVGLAGLILSYAGIAHTFIDGMHALTGLTMFVGLIFTAAGILDGGISTSNRAKITTVVIVAISLGFGIYALATMNTSDFTLNSSTNFTSSCTSSLSNRIYRNEKTRKFKTNWFSLRTSSS